MASIVGQEDTWLEVYGEAVISIVCVRSAILHAILFPVNLPRLAEFQWPGHSCGEVDSLLPGQLTWLNVPFPLPAIAFVA
jgi:hypothetical protein